MTLPRLLFGHVLVWGEVVLSLAVAGKMLVRG